MALKVLQITGAVAVVVMVLLLIPVMLRLRRTVGQVGEIVTESRPQALGLLRKAQGTLESVNRELDNIEEITDETQVLVEKMGQASRAVDKAVRSPLSKVGLVVAGTAAAGFAARRRLSRELTQKRK